MLCYGGRLCTGSGEARKARASVEMGNPGSIMFITVGLLALFTGDDTERAGEADR